jgi:guanylate kinase
MNKGMLIVISGPSGLGKGTVLKRVFERDGNVDYSVSCTTRKPREGERNGFDYHFITKDEFEKNIAENKMLEYAVYCDNYYGTNKEYVDVQRNAGKDVILEIETQGANKVMNSCDEIVSIFIAPPSFEKLKDRLSNRGTESPEVIEKRVFEAKRELESANGYTYIVINDDLDDAVDDVLAILKAERLKLNKINF